MGRGIIERDKEADADLKKVIVADGFTELVTAAWSFTEQVTAVEKSDAVLKLPDSCENSHLLSKTFPGSAKPS